MTGFGIGLLLFGIVLGLVALIKLLAWVDNAARDGVWSALMSRPNTRYVSSNDADDRRFSAVSRGETKPETAETRPSVAETEAEKIHFAETEVARALARLIIADELDLTKAVKIGAGKKSGEGYQKWSRLVRAAIEEQRHPEYPTLAAQQRPSVVDPAR